MGRSLYFSFHYADVSSFRANVVRQSWITMRDRSARFVDNSLWEEAKSKGERFLKELIDESLKGSSVTTVLTGSRTAERPWVKYEIVRSICSGKGILCIHINRIKSKEGVIAQRGENPLTRLGLKISDDLKTINFYHLVRKRWTTFQLLPQVSNRKANSVYFPTQEPWWRSTKAGKFYVLSQLFNQEYDWVRDNGYNNIGEWVEQAYAMAHKA